MIKILASYLKDNEFEKLLDTNTYSVAYRNGILDLKTLEFREGLRSSDYLTRTIPFDYEVAREEDEDRVKFEFRKICNNNESHLDYILSFLGYCMTGDASLLQKLLAIRGEIASNGKSVVLDALCEIIPNYALKMESKTFEISNASKIHKSLATWKGKRIFWINEMSENKQDATTINNFVDGKPMEYEVMYGTKAFMPIMGKLISTSNHTITFDGSNKGIARRINMAQFNSEFNIAFEDNYDTLKFKEDKSFGKKLEGQYKHALLSLIFKYSKRFVDDGFQLCPYPPEWSNETADVIQQNNSFQDIFDANFEVGDEAKVSRKDVLNVFMANGLKLDVKQIKDRLKGMKLVFKYVKNGCINGETGGVFEGFKKRIC
jgi:hypothetical protein